MLRLRRTVSEPRIEIMPLIDVIFLLLTFFIYAMVLMVRVELLSAPWQEFSAGEQGEPVPAITINLALDGRVLVDNQPVAITDLHTHIDGVLEQSPDARLYLALEEGDGDVDRGPILTQVWDALRNAGLDVHFVGAPSSDSASR